MSYVAWLLAAGVVVVAVEVLDQRLTARLETRRRARAAELDALRAFRRAEIEREHGAEVAVVWDAEVELRLAAARVQHGEAW